MASSTEVESGFLANLLSSAGGNLTLDEYLSQNLLNLTVDSKEKGQQASSCDVDLDFLLGGICDVKTEDSFSANIQEDVDKSSSFNLEDFLGDSSTTAFEGSSKTPFRDSADSSSLANFLFADTEVSMHDEPDNEDISLSFTNLCIKSNRCSSSSQESTNSNPSNSEDEKQNLGSNHFDSGYSSDERLLDVELTPAQRDNVIPRLLLKRRREKSDLIKPKPSLFCKVLCTQPRETQRVIPVKLHDVLEAVNYWEYFAFDTESPDELIKLKQEDGLSSYN